MNNLGPRITTIEGAHFLKGLETGTGSPERLLMKLDGTTLRIKQLSWFSIKPTHKKIFDEILEINKVRQAIILERSGTMPRSEANDTLMNQVNGLLQFRIEKLSGYIDNPIEQHVNPIEQHVTKNERFITKIIRFISEYFGWRLSTKNVEALRATVKSL